MADEFRILFLADSHLGFDLPLRPRVSRRRRGDDFLANYQAALRPALDGEVDVVVHGGDVFDRPDVPKSVAYQALEPLRRIAERGVPVLVVPGNHERSRIPHAQFAAHPNVQVFDRPRTVAIDVRGAEIAFAGFPYERDNVRARLPDLLRETGWSEHSGCPLVLCLHHCVEGATVGPGQYTFTTADDVIRLRDIPARFSAVLSGHIHRQQVLATDLNGRSIASPVLYAGSIERTSLAELDEPKGFMIVTIADGVARWEHRELPARPMIRRELDAQAMNESDLEAAIREIVAMAPTDAVLSIRVLGELSAGQWRLLSSARLRALAPRTMNVEIRAATWRPPIRSTNDDDAPAPRRKRDSAAGRETGDLFADRRAELLPSFFGE
jgi:DNA repair exonuclease SbcCD nuclease subunit